MIEYKLTDEAVKVFRHINDLTHDQKKAIKSQFDDKEKAEFDVIVNTAFSARGVYYNEERAQFAQFLADKAKNMFDAHNIKMDLG